MATNLHTIANPHTIDPENFLNYVTSGKATVTLVGRTTRFTYQIIAPMTTTEAGGRKVNHESDVRFVKVLVGPDNNQDFRYMGYLKRIGGEWMPTIVYGGQKAKVSADAPSWKALVWVLRNLNNPDQMAKVELLHSGKCGRCGRKLTTPESLAIGLGPECATRQVA